MMMGYTERRKLGKLVLVESIFHHFILLQIGDAWRQFRENGAHASGPFREVRVCAMQGSNLRLLACEASALPLS
jgi:hypothetical protein